jgi:hypothetical protein
MPISLGPGAEAEPLRVAIIGAVASFRGFCIANTNYSASDSDALIYSERGVKLPILPVKLEGSHRRGAPRNLGGICLFPWSGRILEN